VSLTIRYTIIMRLSTWAALSIASRLSARPSRAGDFIEIGQEAKLSLG